MPLVSGVTCQQHHNYSFGLNRTKKDVIVFIDVTLFRSAAWEFLGCAVYGTNDSANANIITIGNNMGQNANGNYSFFPQSTQNERM
jgi:hypothetical protein